MVKLASVFQRAAKYVTEIGQPAIIGIVEVRKKWYDGLPADLRRIVDEAAAIEATGINPQAIGINERARKAWIDAGGELISLPDEERTAMLKILASVGEDVSRARPELNAAYRTVIEAAQRTIGQEIFTKRTSRY
jgi:TRAP-type C4-dicarboxylate transport system substrate-binding protein